MFGKKKQPSPPFVLQVLTTEYLIEGTVDGDTQLYLSSARGTGQQPYPPQLRSNPADQAGGHSDPNVHTIRSLGR